MYLKATQITIQEDEDGFSLWIDTDTEDSIGFNIQDPALLDVFYEQVRGRILPYLRERDEARRTRPTAEALGVEASYAADDAYALSDPKHPRYHSTHADIWDNRDKTQ